MNNETTVIERIKIHIENRNKILLELQEIYIRNSSHQSSDIDSSMCIVPDTTKESCSPIVEDLLMEMNKNKLRKFDEDNFDCYRCKHFLNIPQNVIEVCENLSDCTEEYEDDLAFVQAVVWLKSATAFMKDISIEQFHLVFHKQWNNNRQKRKDTDRSTRDTISEVQKHNSACLHLNDPLDDVNRKSDITFGTDLKCANSVNLLCNVKDGKKRDLRQYRPNTKENDEGFTNSWSDLSIFTSQSSEGYLMENSGPSNICVIPDSDTESCSDIFKDSLESGEVSNMVRDNNDKLLDENNFIIGVSVGELLLPRNSDLSLKICSESNNHASSNEDGSSDITMFNDDHLLYGPNVDHPQNDGNKWTSLEPITQCVKVANSFSRKENLPVSSNQAENVHSLQKDSAYDTYSLSGEHCILKNEDTSLSGWIINNTTPYQRRNSAIDMHDLEFRTADMVERDCLPDKNRQSCLSLLKLCPSRQNDESTDSCRIERCQQNIKRRSQRNQTFTEDTELTGVYVKKRKLSCTNETDCTFKENIKEKEKMVSSKWLRFRLDALSTDDVAFQSVKIILSVLQDERIARQYMKKRSWNNTLEAQAVNAVLNFRDVFEAEKKSNACTHEIVQTVTNTLEKSIENTELKKVSLLILWIPIVLELCTSMKVCIETINYLTKKLKSQEGILISLTNGKKANVHNIVNQLHITFYVLTLCLQKYRSVFSNKDDNQLEEETIPAVVDLWKKQLNFEDGIVEDSVQKRERRWLMIFDDFTVVAADNFTQFAEKSRKLTNILACK